MTRDDMATLIQLSSLVSAAAPDVCSAYGHRACCDNIFNSLIALVYTEIRACQPSTCRRNTIPVLIHTLIYHVILLAYYIISQDWHSMCQLTHTITMLSQHLWPAYTLSTESTTWL